MRKIAWIYANETFLNFWLAVKSPFCKFHILNPKSIIQWTADIQQHIFVKKRMSLFNLFSLQILINYCRKENMLVTFISPRITYGLILKIFYNIYVLFSCQAKFCRCLPIFISNFYIIFNHWHPGKTWLKMKDGLTYMTIKIDFVRQMFFTFLTQFWIRIPPRMSSQEGICTKCLI